MRACPACGASNGSTEDFCATCGTYLGWSQTPAPSPAAAQPAPEPEPSEPSPAASPEAAPGAPAPAGSPGGTGAAPSGASGTAAPGAGSGTGSSGTTDPAGAASAPVPTPPEQASGDTGTPAETGEAPASEPRRGRLRRAARGAADAVSPGGGAARAAESPEAAEGRVRRAADAPERAEGRLRRAADAVTDGPDAWAGRLRRAVRDGLSGSGSHGSEPGSTPAPPPAPPVGSAPAAPNTPPAAGSAAPAPQGQAPAQRPAAPAPVPPAAPQGSAPAPPVAPQRPAPQESVPPQRPAAPPGQVPPRRPGVPAEDASEPDPAPVRPVLPGRPVAPRPVVRPLPEPEEAEGEPCPNCGTPNPPDRRFCRRCAAPLNPAPARAALPWWRTIWPLRRRVRAGSGRLKRMLVILLVVAVLAVGVFFALPAGRGLFEDTKDKLDGAKPVRPTHTTASAQLPGHPAANTVDGLNNRYWAAPSAGATITYTFAEPIRLVDVILTNGASANLKAYQAQGRALTIDLDTTSSKGGTHHQELTLDDRPGDQTFTTGISDVTTVRLTLRAPTGLTKGHHLALAEVEFFRRG